MNKKMNQDALNEFHNKMGKEIFSFDIISGWRVSLSKINIITL